VVDLCLALETHGVAVREGDYYELAPDFVLLASPNAAVPLTSVIRQAGVMVKALQITANPDASYTSLPSEGVLVMAEGAGISALSSSPHVALGTTCQLILEVDALWQAVANHLEVGCGVGNALVGIAFRRSVSVAGRDVANDSTGVKVWRELFHVIF
jgi:hypothetical protein